MIVSGRPNDVMHTRWLYLLALFVLSQLKVGETEEDMTRTSRRQSMRGPGVVKECELGRTRCSCQVRNRGLGGLHRGRSRIVSSQERLSLS